MESLYSVSSKASLLSRNFMQRTQSHWTSKASGTPSKYQQDPDCGIEGCKHVVLTELSCPAHFPISGDYVWGYVYIAVPEW